MKMTVDFSRFQPRRTLHGPEPCSTRRHGGNGNTAVSPCARPGFARSGVCAAEALPPCPKSLRSLARAGVAARGHPAGGRRGAEDRMMSGLMSDYASNQPHF
jgi:hypothetical protein